MAETQFSLEYVISVSTALASAYVMQRGTPDAPVILKFLLIPLLVAYVTLQIVNFLFPKINEWGQTVQNYFDNRVLGSINSSNYIQIFPPLLLSFVLVLWALFRFF